MHCVHSFFDFSFVVPIVLNGQIMNLRFVMQEIYDYENKKVSGELLSEDDTIKYHENTKNLYKYISYNYNSLTMLSTFLGLPNQLNSQNRQLQSPHNIMLNFIHWQDNRQIIWTDYLRALYFGIMNTLLLPIKVIKNLCKLPLLLTHILTKYSLEWLEKNGHVSGLWDTIRYAIMKSAIMPLLFILLIILKLGLTPWESLEEFKQLIKTAIISVSARTKSNIARLLLGLLLMLVTSLFICTIIASQAIWCVPGIQLLQEIPFVMQLCNNLAAFMPTVVSLLATLGTNISIPLITTMIVFFSESTLLSMAPALGSLVFVPIMSFIIDIFNSLWARITRNPEPIQNNQPRLLAYHANSFFNNHAEAVNQPIQEQNNTQTCIHLNKCSY